MSHCKHIFPNRGGHSKKSLKMYKYLDVNFMTKQDFQSHWVCCLHTYLSSSLLVEHKAEHMSLHFYPTTLKGCQGIVFTHGVWMGGRREKVCLGCISETIRCRKLILGGNIG